MKTQPPLTRRLLLLAGITAAAAAGWHLAQAPGTASTRTAQASARPSTPPTAAVGSMPKTASGPAVEAAQDTGAAPAAPGFRPGPAPSAGQPALAGAAAAKAQTPGTPAALPPPVVPPVKRMEDFDPAAALASGHWYHPDLPENEVRARMAAYLQERAMRSKQRALNLAAQFGWPVRQQFPNGGLAELVGVDEQDRPLYHSTSNDSAAITTAASQIRNVSPYNLNGRIGSTPMNFGVWDAGSIRSTHQEFPSAVVLKNSSASLHDHATHVGGTIAARGIRAQALGMAPEARLLSYDWNSDTSEMVLEYASSAAFGARILISNHSYGYISGWHWGYNPPAYFGRYPAREDEQFGQYGTSSRELDQISYNHPFTLTFWAAGNDRSDNAPSSGQSFQYHSGSSWVTKSYVSGVDPQSDGASGGFDTMGTQGSAKNLMTIGAVTAAVNSSGSRSPSSATMSSFSNWGPTDDGRIKPDLVAKGVGVYSPLASSNNAYASWNGTSMATPNAAGSALLLQELYAENFNGEAMRASMLKGLMIHTADDIGNPGPDYSNGWGLVNVKRAADLIRAHRSAPSNQTLVTGVLSGTSTSHQYTFQWDGVSPIRATICWTDPAGTARTGVDNTSRALVNDLDIRLARSGGSTHQPYVLNPSSPSSNATTGDNNRDPVEQIYVASPATGTYTLTVNYKGSLTGGSQVYSLILSGQRQNTTSPVLAVSTNSLNVTAAVGSNPAAQSFTVRNAGAGSLSYSITDDASWITVNPTSGDSSGESDTIQVTFSTTSLAAGSYTGRIFVTSSGLATQEVQVSLLVGGNNASLLAALDLPNGTALTNSGQVPWFGQTLVSQDGVDAGRSGVITHNQESGVAMTVTGPGTLSFWWRTDSEANYDILRFEIGTSQQASISGNTAWAQRTYSIPAGQQTLRWRYTKDTSVSSGADAGFVDMVSYVSNLPRLELSNTTLTASTPQGGSPAALSFGVRNAGGGSLAYTITDNVSWLSTSPTSGDSTGETDNIQVNFATSSLAPGTHQGRITIASPGLTSAVVDVTLTVTSTSTNITLASALDANPAPVWNTTSSQSGGGWFGQSTTTRDGQDAARNGTGLPDNASSTLSTTITGPAVVRFWWRVDSEAGYDFLSFRLNNVEQDAISGSTSWAEKVFNLPAGTHSLAWVYAKDISITRGLDGGFVDMVSITTVVPQIQVSPASLTLSTTQGASPAQASLSVRNAGGGTLSYSLATPTAWLSNLPASGSSTGTNVSHAVRFSTASLPPGTHNGSVVVQGGVAGTLTVPVTLTVTPAAATPISLASGTYLQNFQAGLPTPASGWTFTSTEEGRCQVVGGVLRMDDHTPGSAFSLNEAVLHANLAGRSRITLSFRHREDNDENHSLPASFSNNHNGDGVCISADGTTWHRVEALEAADGTWRNYVVNLDAAIAAAGISYTSNFRIKFQQYDDFSATSDGYDFDDISLRQGTATSDDHGNNIASGTPLGLPGTLSGVLEERGDLDFFLITVAAAGDLTVTSAGSTDTMADLYSPTGALLSTDDDSGPGLNFMLRFPVSPGVYALRVRGYGSSTGAYQVSAAHAPYQRMTAVSTPGSSWSQLPMVGFELRPGYRITMRGMIASGYGPTLNAVGQISMVINPRTTANPWGTFTGTIELDGGRWPFRGEFTASGGVSSWSGVVPRTQASQLQVQLSFMRRDAPFAVEWRLRGTVNDGLTTTALDLFENYDWSNIIQRGSYTFLIPHEDNGSSTEPQGDGYGTLSVTRTGDATLQAVLPDGTRFTEPTFLTFDHLDETPDMQVFRVLQARPASHFASITRFSPVANVSDFDGHCHWVKGSGQTSGIYRGGFRLNRRVIGSVFLHRGSYTAELPGLDEFSTGNARAQWMNRALAVQPGQRVLTWNWRDAITFAPSGDVISLSVNPTTGQLSGSYRDPRTGVSFPYGGVIFQKQRLASGHFISNDEAGSFLLRPNP